MDIDEDQEDLKEFCGYLKARLNKVKAELKEAKDALAARPPVQPKPQTATPGAEEQGPEIRGLRQRVAELEDENRRLTEGMEAVTGELRLAQAAMEDQSEKKPHTSTEASQQQITYLLREQETLRLTLEVAEEEKRRMQLDFDQKTEALTGELRENVERRLEHERTIVDLQEKLSHAESERDKSQAVHMLREKVAKVEMERNAAEEASRRFHSELIAAGKEITELRSGNPLHKRPIFDPQDNLVDRFASVGKAIAAKRTAALAVNIPEQNLDILRSNNIPILVLSSADIFWGHGPNNTHFVNISPPFHYRHCDPNESWAPAADLLQSVLQASGWGGIVEHKAHVFVRFSAPGKPPRLSYCGKYCCSEADVAWESLNAKRKQNLLAATVVVPSDLADLPDLATNMIKSMYDVKVLLPKALVFKCVAFDESVYHRVLNLPAPPSAESTLTSTTVVVGQGPQHDADGSTETSPQGAERQATASTSAPALEEDVGMDVDPTMEMDISMDVDVDMLSSTPAHPVFTSTPKRPAVSKPPPSASTIPTTATATTAQPPQAPAADPTSDANPNFRPQNGENEKLSLADRLTNDTRLCNVAAPLPRTSQPPAPVVAPPPSSHPPLEQRLMEAFPDRENSAPITPPTPHQVPPASGSQSHPLPPRPSLPVPPSIQVQAPQTQPSLGDRLSSRPPPSAGQALQSSEPHLRPGTPTAPNRGRRYAPSSRANVGSGHESGQTDAPPPLAAPYKPALGERLSSNNDGGGRDHRERDPSPPPPRRNQQRQQYDAYPVSRRESDSRPPDRSVSPPPHRGWDRYRGSPRRYPLRSNSLPGSPPPAPPGSNSYRPGAPPGAQRRSRSRSRARSRSSSPTWVPAPPPPLWDRIRGDDATLTSAYDGRGRSRGRSRSRSPGREYEYEYQRGRGSNKRRGAFRGQAPPSKRSRYPE